MDSFDILDETDLLQERRLNQRPVFLLVLCILTWVGSGFSLIYNFFVWFGLSTAKELLTNGFNTNFGQQAFNYYNLLIWQSIAGIFACVICTIGAILMFKLKRIGFFIYLFGQILVLGFMVFLFLYIPSGTSEFSEFTRINLVFSVVYAIFPIAFIAMYGVNLKYMK